MNKNIILAIGFFLVSIIAYQGYLLYKKDNSNRAIVPISTKNIQADKPQVNININKQTPKTNVVSNLTQEQRLKLDQQRIEENLKNLLKSIFESKEVQEGLKEFKSQAQIAFQELQKELQELPKQLDNLTAQAQNDPFLSELFKTLKNIPTSQLEDRGDYYYKKLELPDGKNSKVDISVDNGFLTISISSKKDVTTTSQNSTISKHSSTNTKSIIALPSDALVQKIDTNYKDGVLEIKIPKIKAKGSV